MGLQDADGATEVGLVGELKTPCAYDHELPAAIASQSNFQSNFRRKIAQPERDMRKLHSLTLGIWSAQIRTATLNHCLKWGKIRYCSLRIDYMANA